MAMLNLATGDYDEVGSSGEWYLDDVIGNSKTNAAAMHEDELGNNYVYAAVQNYQTQGNHVLARLDSSSMKVVATLSSWTYSAAIVRDTYYYADDGGFGDSVHVVKDIHTANPVVDTTEVLKMKTGLWTATTKPAAKSPRTLSLGRLSRASAPPTPTSTPTARSARS